jgi:hypothetical protein
MFETNTTLHFDFAKAQPTEAEGAASRILLQDNALTPPSWQRLGGLGNIQRMLGATATAAVTARCGMRARSSACG